MRVLVTREELVARVESLGHDAILCELIRVEPLGDDPVDARAYDWLVVTSRNGAHELARRGVSANCIAAIGPATAEALRSHGLRVDLVAATHTQEGLRDELPAGTVLLAKAMMLVFALRPMVYDELMRDHTLTAQLFAAHMHADHAFSSDLQAALDSAEVRPPGDLDQALALRKRVMAEARHRDSTASRAQRELLVREYEDSLMARKGEGSLPIFGELLNMWDVLWVSLGVSSARELARRRVS